MTEHESTAHAARETRMHYNHKTLEKAVQKTWTESDAFTAHEDPHREKFYCLSMLPYPSGRLHVGHIRNYAIGDAIARFQRMQGKNVLQPMGWDAFGLPAENAAIANKRPAAEWTKANIATMRAQLDRMGFAFDWSREVTTCDAGYYRWEQWFFTRLVEKGLAYRARATVNWDPVDHTVLANEQIKADGTAWRSGAQVERKEVEQWFIKSTAYADELLTAIDDLTGWPEEVRTMQRKWIGRSEGLEITFSVPDEEEITVFTSRPDTIMGVNVLALAAEHPCVTRVARHNSAVRDFVVECKAVGTTEAAVGAAEKQGMPLGITAVHPISGAHIPIWVANFVLMQYGTGAVMVVPGHDKRDHDFSRQYGLPIIQVVRPDEKERAEAIQITDAPYEGYGTLINSDALNGMDFDAAFSFLHDTLATQGKATKRVNYRLRDWGVSRQRYWGCPIPIIFDADGVPQSVACDDLPVQLPELSFVGVKSPLIDHKPFTDVTLADGTVGKRETDTFDTFVESSWYYARYCSFDADAMIDTRADYWLPVDQYVGGIEHATMHLMYARVFHKMLRDEGLVQSDEPFTRLLCQGMVVDRYFYRMHTDADGKAHIEYFAPEEIDITYGDDGQPASAVACTDGQPVLVSDKKVKVSKSKKNGIDPEPLIDNYGADAMRLFILFTAPPEKKLEWSDTGLAGSYRFLQRLWRIVHEGVAEYGIDHPTIETKNLNGDARKLWQTMHRTIAKVTADIGDRYKFNTAIAAIMTLLNTVQKHRPISKQACAVHHAALRTIVLLLAPIVPHICSALYEMLGETQPLCTADGDAAWPVSDSDALFDTTVIRAVQVNGKRRAEITVAVDADDASVRHAALADDHVRRHTDGKTVRKVIVTPKVINIVV